MSAMPRAGWARRPALLVVTAVVLCIGISANAVMFGVVDQLLLRPPVHVRNPQELRRIYFQEHGGSQPNYPLVTLLQVFNGSEQPFRLSFSEPTYSYALGQLFRDHRLLGSRQSLLDVLDGALPADAAVEKGEDGQRFAGTSLFGFVVETASAPDDFLICDDIGTEWADFLGVATTDHRVSFYHCKGGGTDVGASDLHEVVAQATKNLGYLTASSAELDARKRRWNGQWNQRPIARLQRGASVDDFVGAFVKAVVAPQATRRVVIVTSSLSKTALARAFDDLDHAMPAPEVVHVLWLLSTFVDQCRTVGAVPHIVCRP